MLLVNIDEIPHGGKAIDESLGVEWVASLVFPEVYQATAPAHIALLVRKAKTHIRVTGQLDLELDVTCCRCLSPSAQQIRVNVDQKYFPATANLGPLAPMDDGSDELDQFYYKGNMLDLEQGVRERFVFELNPHPTCQGECSMPAEASAAAAEPTQDQWVDPRWAKLRDIKLD